jgi:hypothetical protein
MPSLAFTVMAQAKKTMVLHAAIAGAIAVLGVTVFAMFSVGSSPNCSAA